MVFAQVALSKACPREHTLPLHRCSRLLAPILVVLCGCDARVQPPAVPPPPSAPLRPFRQSTPVKRPQRTDPLSDVTARVIRLTGPVRADCGQFIRRIGSQPSMTPEQHERAVQCGVAAAARKVPFWFIATGQGIDSWIASGLFAGEDGIVHRFSYDGDPSGGSGSEPYFDAEPCLRPRVVKDDSGGSSLRCANDRR